MVDMGLGECRFGHKECCKGNAEVKNEHGVPMCKPCLLKYHKLESRKYLGREFTLTNFSW
ncbi:MAG: hypothetical protein CML17_01190 [Pusillimonas sp.]|nr:hypothetical protein [Pusillimonas sp.]